MLWRGSGPVFGEAAGVGEDQVDFGVADLEPGELVGEPAAVYVVEFVQRRVPGLDQDGASGSSESGRIWKASVPSESVAARLSRLYTRRPQARFRRLSVPRSRLRGG